MIKKGVIRFCNSFYELQPGVSYVEVVVSIGVLSILMLSLADFSSNAFGVSYNHLMQVEEASQTRFSAERMVNEINQAAYIFPSGLSISLSGTKTVTINTSSAVAILVPTDMNANPVLYNLIAFYLVDNGDKADLYEFKSSTGNSWPANTLPISKFASVSGKSSLIASDIDKSNSSLSYLMNYGNGLTDPMLQGSISGINTNVSTALLKGVNWNLVIKKAQSQTVSIKGISKNVPRFM